MSKPSLDVNDTSPAERLELIEELSDGFRDHPEDLPIADTQREELDRRLDDLERSGPRGISLEDVLQRIRTRVR